MFITGVRLLGPCLLQNSGKYRSLSGKVSSQDSSLGYVEYTMFTFEF